MKSNLDFRSYYGKTRIPRWNQYHYSLMKIASQMLTKEDMNLGGVYTRLLPTDLGLVPTEILNC